MPDSLPIPLTAPLSRAQETALINLVRRAARAEIMPRFRNLGHADISAKSSAQDLVTEADHAAEAMLARGVQRMLPHALVVGEEAVAGRAALRDEIAAAELAVVIDPLDGTWNFAHGLPLFGVIVAITRFGRPVFGLLYDPVIDDWIVAREGERTHLARTGGAERPLRMGGGGALRDLSGFIHLYLLPEDKRAAMAAALPEFARTSMLRCSCHEYRTLAQGGMDFCLSGVLNPWDHAAGVLACRQAGGVARLMDGRDYDAGVTEGYLLTAPDEDSWQRLRDRFAFLLE
ncbi:inositol monophosphatase family protein [Roseovarius salinarum]|uniref:inositol monophosphatase family protein n=1 Tax=Roseovarius salinarum TaxID=1981892 RepID=UPI000C3497C7|nr:inositol monophosphatase [Roseovarius salinarum]